jgi:hypothetical protein
MNNNEDKKFNPFEHEPFKSISIPIYYTDTEIYINLNIFNTNIDKIIEIYKNPRGNIYLILLKKKRIV